MASVTLIDPEETFTFLIVEAVNKCSLFQNNPTLLASPDQLESSVTLSIFSEFLQKTFSEWIQSTDTVPIRVILISARKSTDKTDTGFVKCQTKDRHFSMVRRGESNSELRKRTIREWRIDRNNRTKSGIGQSLFFLFIFDRRIVEINFFSMTNHMIGFPTSFPLS
jgi:hypothetical protein